MLSIVATPIGNLKDITLRALEVLESSDAIICEDTRRTSKLLEHYNIKKPLLVLNDFNETKQLSSIIDRLKLDQALSLVSDAGTPLISDPGFKLVRECIKEGIKVDSIPGPVSLIVALTQSGLPTDKFTFLGYPPDKPGHRVTFYQKIRRSDEILKSTYILFIAPFKLIKTLTEMQDILGDISISLSSELTKVYQKTDFKKISEFLEVFKSKPPKGEWIMCLNLSVQSF